MVVIQGEEPVVIRIAGATTVIVITTTVMVMVMMVVGGISTRIWRRPGDERPELPTTTE